MSTSSMFLPFCIFSIQDSITSGPNSHERFDVEFFQILALSAVKESYMDMGANLGCPRLKGYENLI